VKLKCRVKSESPIDMIVKNACSTHFIWKCSLSKELLQVCSIRCCCKHFVITWTFFYINCKIWKTRLNRSHMENQTPSSFGIDLIYGDGWNGIHIYGNFFSVKTKAAGSKLCTHVVHNYMPSFKLLRPGNWPEDSCLAPWPSHGAPL
jgi:hypothetical protein